MIAAAFACGMAAAVVLGAAIWSLARDGVIARRVRDRVIVTTKTGDSFAGVLYAHDRKAMVLREAEALGVAENRTNLALDGELVVLLCDVAYIQNLKG